MIGSRFIDAARAGKNGFWRYLGTFSLAMFLWIMATVVTLVAGIVLSAGSIKLEEWDGRLLFAVSLAPFALITFGIWAGLRVLHERPFLSLVNPARKISWKKFAFGAGVWLGLSILSDGVTAVLQPGNYQWVFNFSAFLPYLVLALALIPIQASAEEFLFRGYLTQGLGLIRWWLGWVLPALVFGLMHGLNPEVDTYGFLLSMPTYIGMGLLLGWVTLRSESLEMAIGMHIINNLYASLAVTFPSSALQSETLFRIQRYDPAAGLVSFAVISFLFLVIFEAGRRRLWRSPALLPLGILAALLLSSCSQGQNPTATPTPGAQPSEQVTLTPTPEPGLSLHDCLVDIPNQSMKEKALCGTLEVLENREEPGGRVLTLNILVFKAVSRTPEPDPVFLLAGGPGQAASDVYRLLFGAFQKIRAKRDLVLIDQRGTGASAPLNCPDAQTSPEIITADRPVAEEMAELDACLVELKPDHDLSQYTTRAAIEDFEDARKALGYGPVNLIGVSYGTTAALGYLSLYPNSVRTMVLDGVAPLEWTLGASLRADSQRALDLIFQRCAEDAACAEAFPTIRGDFYDLMSNLNRTPAEVTVPDPVTAEPLKVRVTPALVAVTVRAMSYSDLTVALMPLMIRRAAQGDYSMLASQYLMMTQSLSENMSVGLYYSVWCYEEYPQIPEEGELGAYYFPVDYDAFKQVCSRWPAVEGFVNIPAPSSSTVPVLILSGEDDPVTPPVNGDQVAKQLTNSLHIVLPGMGHGNLHAGCVPTLVRDFIVSGSPAGLGTNCTREIQPMPIFVSPVGPRP